MNLDDRARSGLVSLPEENILHHHLGRLRAHLWLNLGFGAVHH
jgi:hypothetical protein